jgi:hypothetical protein
MPMSREQRYQILRQCFTDISLSGSTHGLGAVFHFTTADPGDDAGTGDTGTTQNESTVTSAGAVSGSYITTYDGPNGHALKVLPNNQALSAASGSAVFTHLIMRVSAGHNFWEQMPYPVNVASSDVVRFAPYKLKFGFSDVVSNWWALEDEFSTGLLEALTSFSTASGVSLMYMALSSTAPAPDGTNVTEPTGGGYARTLVDTSGTGIDLAVRQVGWGTSNIAQAYNLANITFPTATAPWSGLTHWAMYDAFTGGNLCFFGALDSTVNVLTGETPSFLIDDWHVNSPP